MVQHEGQLFMGTSDGYIIRLNLTTGAIDNLGKPVRAIGVMGMAFSPLDGMLYGVSGGGLEGMSRFWACDVQAGTFEMDLDESKDGKLHVRPVCKVGVNGAGKNSGLYAMECGPDGRIYWASNGGRNVPLDLFAWDPRTKKKTYLGSCALGGQWLTGGSCQGLCLDRHGNLALHVLYAEISPAQKRFWKVPPDFFYEDIKRQPHFLQYPAHRKGTYYAVYYVKSATAMRQ